MTDWNDRVEDLLFDGEAIEEAIDVGDARVVVTSHRVLVFTPETEGANLQQADRPNAEGVRIDASGRDQLRQFGVKAGGVGLLALVLGSLISLDGLLAAPETGGAASRIGIGGLMSMLGAVVALVNLLDDLLRAAGAFALLVGVGAVGVYLWTRRRYLVIDVAGDETMRMPAPENTERAVERIRAALGP